MARIGAVRDSATFAQEKSATLAEEAKILAEEAKILAEEAKILAEEEGSISPLILGFFTMVMLLIFLISNVAASYIARRDLTSRVEESLAVAAQELDKFSYYYGSPLTDYLTSRAVEEGSLFVPIDCGSARAKFQEALSASGPEIRLEISPDINPEISPEMSPESNLESKLESNLETSPAKSTVIKSFQCDGSTLLAIIRERAPLPFQIRAFGIRDFVNEVRVGIGSNYLP